MKNKLFKKIQQGVFFALFIFCNVFNADAQCTAATTPAFVSCVTAKATPINVTESFAVSDNLDLSGLTIDIRNQRSISLTGTILINASTLFTGNGNAAISHAGATASNSPGQGQISFTELNTRMQSGQYNTLEDAMLQRQSVLPVLLDEFYGQWSDGVIELNWTTISEVNNDLFAIEHSLEGKEYKTISEIYGHGTTSEVKNYAFVQDEGYIEGVNYYRLKQIDFDGKITYSPVIIVKVPLKNQVKLRPTVVINMLNIDFQEGTRAGARIQIIRSNGQLIIEVPVEKNIETLSMDLSELRPGFYYLRLIEEDSYFTTNFIKS